MLDAGKEVVLSSRSEFEVVPFDIIRWCILSTCCWKDMPAAKNIAASTSGLITSSSTSYLYGPGVDKGTPREQLYVNSKLFCSEKVYYLRVTKKKTRGPEAYNIHCTANCLTNT